MYVCIVEFNVPLDTLWVISGKVFTANLLDVNSRFLLVRWPNQQCHSSWHWTAKTVVQIGIRSHQDHTIILQ